MGAEYGKGIVREGLLLNVRSSHMGRSRHQHYCSLLQVETNNVQCVQCFLVARKASAAGTIKPCVQNVGGIA